MDPKVEHDPEKYSPDPDNPGTVELSPEENCTMFEFIKSVMCDLHQDSDYYHNIGSLTTPDERGEFGLYVNFIHLVNPRFYTFGTKVLDTLRMLSINTARGIMPSDARVPDKYNIFRVNKIVKETDSKKKNRKNRYRRRCSSSD